MQAPSEADGQTFQKGTLAVRVQVTTPGVAGFSLILSRAYQHSFNGFFKSPDITGRLASVYEFSAFKIAKEILIIIYAPTHQRHVPRRQKFHAPIA